MKTNFFARKTRSTSRNPFIHSIYTADPSAHVWDDGRMYIYASRDMDPARGCDLMDHYHVFSSDDMVNWRDEGEILCSDDVNWGRPEGGFMWAPDCAYRNGKYYFYYPHPSDTHWNDSWKIGVAVSDKPGTGFVDQGYIENLGGDCMIDPCVFIDDDSRVYMYYGGGGMCRGGEMNDDMVSMKELMRPMEGIVDFHEATWVFKRNDLYYITYSDNHPGNNRMHYGTSRNPLGPWEYKGVYLEPTGCDTSHGSIVKFKEQWYALYHCQDVSGQGNLRSICCDPVEFSEDGTMYTVVQSRNGRRPVGLEPKMNPDLREYGASTCECEGGAELADEGLAYENKVIRGLKNKDSAIVFNNVDGFNGGRVDIGFYYAADAHLSKLRLIVNDVDYSFINFIKTGWHYTFTGYSNITLNLNPLETNTIKLVGGHGDIRLEAMTVEPID